MEKRKRLVLSIMPVRFPLGMTLTFCLVLDRLSAPGWVWGAVLMFMGFLWLNSLYRRGNQEEVNIIKRVEDLEDKLGEYMETPKGEWRG